MASLCHVGVMASLCHVGVMASLCHVGVMASLCHVGVMASLCHVGVMASLCHVGVMASLCHVGVMASLCHVGVMASLCHVGVMASLCHVGVMASLCHVGVMASLCHVGVMASLCHVGVMASLCHVGVMASLCHVGVMASLCHVGVMASLCHVGVMASLCHVGVMASLCHVGVMASLCHMPAQYPCTLVVWAVTTDLGTRVSPRPTRLPSASGRESLQNTDAPAVALHKPKLTSRILALEVASTQTHGHLSKLPSCITSTHIPTARSRHPITQYTQSLPRNQAQHENPTGHTSNRRTPTSALSAGAEKVTTVSLTGIAGVREYVLPPQKPGLPSPADEAVTTRFHSTPPTTSTQKNTRRPLGPTSLAETHSHRQPALITNDQIRSKPSDSKAIP
ncbi:hypothetical protein EDB84DRAFT_1443049 [Lactarius hengduanensis]|nr:hypothetical protein EDB84DRAFT_1443049 [Lactarius hengduanensis]